MIEIKVPVLGESITLATVAKLHKKVGDFVKEDEMILELETEKINLEITATQAGLITQINVSEDSEVKVGDIVSIIDETKVDTSPSREKKVEETVKTEKTKVEPVKFEAIENINANINLDDLSPAVRALVLEHNIDIANVKSSGKDGRILKSDILEYLENKDKISVVNSTKIMPSFSRNTTTEKLPNIRKTIAKRLKEAQNTAAILTTFNEVDMSYVMKVRKSLKEDFAAKNGVNLGFMSFFTKAVCAALQEFPKVNAYWLENEIQYHEYCDISIAVASEKGLFVPVIRNAESLSFAQIEQTIKDFAIKAKTGSLSAADMQGGTFSITNGGTFGSMLSTPIINLPQSAILGMHNIVERPVAVNGKVEIRPIMYVALSYDHRMVDGSQAVSFLVKVKELLENPEKLMFDL
jgi:2-oxoglutarate dehydrogenase E2 component (dihydrolipoamide succinyltransferase)